MSANRCWDVDPKTTLDVITRWCIDERQVDRMFVVARPDNDKPGRLLEARVQTAVERLFAGNIIRTQWTSAWAGTQLLRRREGKVWIISFNEDVRDRLISAENTIRGWRHNAPTPLPEDICLYRTGDDLPTFVSVTHDGEAWVFDPAAENAPFVVPAELALPADLLPPPPDFVAPG
jgi:hypothetical protein